MSKKWQRFNESFAKRVDWRRVGTELLGLDLSGNDSNGWVSCKHWDGNDGSNSCSFNVETGYFKDFRTGNKAISGFDALILKGEAKHFGEARAKLVGMFGLKMPDLDKDDPEFGVKWKPWDDRQARLYCNVKKGVTVYGLKRAAARLCMRHGVMCIALPVSDYDGVIVGWMFLRQNGEPFEQKGGNSPKAICKVRDKSNGAFVCDPAVMRELKELAEDDERLTIFWCEGAPDMLAGLSHEFKEEHWFITNCHGTQENIQWFGHADVVLISDADVPGLAGAFKRARKDQPVYVPPGPRGLKIEKDHGYDYRDFLCSFNVPNAHPLTGLVQQQSDEEIAKREEDRREEEVSRGMEAAYKRAEKLLTDCGCHIISIDDAERMTLYSEHTHQTKKVTSIDKLSYEQMIQLLGYRFQAKVLGTQKEIEAMAAAGQGGYRSFTDFKRALALAATASEYLDLEEVGVGIWAVEDKDQTKTGDMLLVKHAGAYKFDGNRLTQIRRPVIGRQIANLAIKNNWFDVEKLADYIERSKDVDFREQTYNALYALVRQWNWENDFMPQTAIGLFMATYIQALLEWRPIVALTGESNSGKTVFMKLLNTLYLGLAQFSAQSTAAGVLQNMGISSRPLLLDEFDSGQEQQKLLNHFRVGSRGQEMLKGTASQDGKSYKIQHIPWIAGIHAGSRSQADVNRMIPLRIKQAKGNAYTLNLPDSHDLRDLGHRVLAGVLVSAQAAMSMSQDLLKKGGDGNLQSRYRESYSVPYACLGAFMGLTLDEIDGIMSQYLNLEVTKQVILEDASSDQEALLMDILQSEVRMPREAPMETASVAEVLFDPELSGFRNHARTKGVGFVVPKKGNDKKVCFVGRRLTAKHGILRSTDWEHVAGLLQILERLPAELKPVKEKQNVGGSTATCVSVDWYALKKWNSRANPKS